MTTRTTTTKTKTTKPYGAGRVARD